MAKKRTILIAVLLVLAMVITTACTDSGEVKQPANISGDSGDTGAGGDAGNPAGKVDVAIAETVLYDAGGIKVTATGYADSWMGPEIKLLVENNSAGNVLVTAESVSINGYMMPYAGLYADVAAGKKANESLSVMTSALDQAGIETVAQIQLRLTVSDADTWNVLAKSDLITLDTSAAGFQQPVDDSGDLLYEADGIRIICKGLKQDVVWDGTIVFYMENNSGLPITVYAENVSVNGFMQDVSLWSDLRDGTRIIDGMSLLDLSDLELKSIDDIENIEFSLRIINSETWDEIDTTDVITLNFE